MTWQVLAPHGHLKGAGKDACAELETDTREKPAVFLPIPMMAKPPVVRMSALPSSIADFFLSTQKARHNEDLFHASLAARCGHVTVSWIKGSQQECCVAAFRNFPLFVISSSILLLGTCMWWAMKEGLPHGDGGEESREGMNP